MPAPDLIWAKAQGLAIRQGELLSRVIQVEIAPEGLLGGTLQVQPKLHPWALVLSQDCDADQDWAARTAGDPIEGHNKEIPAILLCEALSEDELRKRPTVNSDLWRSIRKNKDERYHVLDELPPELDRELAGASSLILDFKRTFAVSTAGLYAQLDLADESDLRARRHAFLRPPFRDFVSTRAFGYHARVAVPE